MIAASTAKGKERRQRKRPAKIGRKHAIASAQENLEPDKDDNKALLRLRKHCWLTSEAATCLPGAFSETQSHLDLSIGQSHVNLDTSRDCAYLTGSRIRGQRLSLKTRSLFSSIHLP
jgi:hypothetical protein